MVEEFKIFIHKLIDGFPRVFHVSLTCHNFVREILLFECIINHIYFISHLLVRIKTKCRLVFKSCLFQSVPGLYQKF